MGKTYYVMDLDMYDPFEWASAKHEMVAASETDAAERHAAATVEESSDYELPAPVADGETT